MTTFVVSCVEKMTIKQAPFQALLSTTATTMSRHEWIAIKALLSNSQGTFPTYILTLLDVIEKKAPSYLGPFLSFTTNRTFFPGKHFGGQLQLRLMVLLLFPAD